MDNKLLSLPNTLRKHNMSDGKNRKDIQIGIEVEVIQKHHQRSGELTEGIVKKILTNSPTHSSWHKSDVRKWNCR